MQIDDNLINHLAHLARIEFTPEAKQAMKNDLDRMIQFVEKLNEIKTENIEPLIYMNNEVNILRDDEVIQTISQKEALLNAPKHDSDYFKVPKMIKK